MGRGGDPQTAATGQRGLLVGRRRRRSPSVPQTISTGATNSAAADAGNSSPTPLTGPLRLSDLEQMFVARAPELAKLDPTRGHFSGSWVLSKGPQLEASGENGENFWQAVITAESIAGSPDPVYYGIANWGKVGNDGTFKDICCSNSLDEVCAELNARQDRKYEGSLSKERYLPPNGARYTYQYPKSVLEKVSAKLGL